mgnify:CR=1 FL=1
MIKILDKQHYEMIIQALDFSINFKRAVSALGTMSYSSKKLTESIEEIYKLELIKEYYELLLIHMEDEE